MSEAPQPTAPQLAPGPAGRAVRSLLDALAVLVDEGDVANESAAIAGLQRRLGLAVTGEVTPGLLRQAQAAAQAVHAAAQVQAAIAAETAAGLYEQIAGDREREIEAVRARHPARPTSLTEEEVGASRLAAGRCALEAAGHWRRAALSREAAAALGSAAPEATASPCAAVTGEASPAGDASRAAGARPAAAAAGAGETSEASPSTHAAAEGGASRTAAAGPTGAAAGLGEASEASTHAAAEGGASRTAGAGPTEAAAGAGEASEASPSTHADTASRAAGTVGAAEAWVSAARARARAWRAATAAGPWFRSAAAGHLAAGDRLQGSRALEGALKAAALVAEATAPVDAWP